MMLHVDHGVLVMCVRMAHRPCQQQGGHDEEQGALKAQGPDARAHTKTDQGSAFRSRRSVC